MFSLLASSNFIVVNKVVAKTLGLDAAVMLGELCSEQQYWAKTGDLDANEGWFYSTMENVEEATTLSPYKQRSIIAKLCDAGILEQKVSGLPAKRYFRMNVEGLAKLVGFSQQDVKPLSTEMSKNFTTVCENSSHLYNNNKKNNKNNHIDEPSCETDAPSEEHVQPKVGFRADRKQRHTFVTTGNPVRDYAAANSMRTVGGNVPMVVPNYTEGEEAFLDQYGKKPKDVREFRRAYQVALNSVKGNDRVLANCAKLAVKAYVNKDGDCRFMPRPEQWLSDNGWRPYECEARSVTPSSRFVSRIDTSALVAKDGEGVDVAEGMVF